MITSSKGEMMQSVDIDELNDNDLVDLGLVSVALKRTNPLLLQAILAEIRIREFADTGELPW